MTPEERLLPQYEYLDHTADVQLHSWGNSLTRAIEEVVLAMYGYMTTDFEKVQNEYSMDFSASGQDINQMLYNLLDTCLYHFSTEPFFIGRWCQVLSLEQRCQGDCIKTFGDDGGDGTEPFSIILRCFGESFDLKKHPPGTEIKAITYSNMQINQPAHSTTASQPEKRRKEDRGSSDESTNSSGLEGAEEKSDLVHIYVIVDI